MSAHYTLLAPRTSPRISLSKGRKRTNIVVKVASNRGDLTQSDPAASDCPRLDASMLAGLAPPTPFPSTSSSRPRHLRRRSSRPSCLSSPPRSDLGRVSRRFDELSTSQEPALIPYICAGDPSLDVSAQVLSDISYNGGVDLIEVGIPYSDPLADGPVIQVSGMVCLWIAKRSVGMLDVWSLDRGGLLDDSAVDCGN